MVLFQIVILLMDAINEVENKTFFFQTFEYVSTASQTTFTSTDRNGNTLSMKPGRFQVFLNKSSSAEHLVEGELIITPAHLNWSEILILAIQLNVGASSGNVLTIYTFTGSALGTGEMLVVVELVSLQRQAYKYNLQYQF